MRPVLTDAEQSHSGQSLKEIDLEQAFLKNDYLHIYSFRIHSKISLVLVHSIKMSFRNKLKNFTQM